MVCERQWLRGMELAVVEGGLERLEMMHYERDDLVLIDGWLTMSME